MGKTALPASLGTVSVDTAECAITLCNDLLRVKINTADGTISRCCSCVLFDCDIGPAVSWLCMLCRSCTFLPLGREVTSGAAGAFVTYQDVPFYWFVFRI